MMILKVTKKQSYTFSSKLFFFFKYILRVKVWIYVLNEISFLVFVELAVFHSIYRRISLGKIVKKTTR